MDFRIEVSDLHRVAADQLLWRAICDIVVPNYVNPDVILHQELSNNDRVYLAFSGDRLAGFFMTGWHSAQPKNTDHERSVYLGLSGVSGAYRGKGLGSALYRRFLQDAQSWSRTHGLSLWWWFYTASPLAAAAWWKLVPAIYPQQDGTIDNRACRLLDSLERKFGWTGHRDEEWSFVLRKFAQARYLPTEHALFEEKMRLQACDIFGLTTLDESVGDRFIFVGETTVRS
jgi:GNAT superfamily N-acetyltransferase